MKKQPVGSIVRPMAIKRLWGVFLAVLLFPWMVHGQGGIEGIHREWVYPMDGNFEDFYAWSPVGDPLAGDLVRFDHRGQAIQINFNEDRAFSVLRMIRGDFRFNIGTDEVGDNRTLTISPTSGSFSGIPVMIGGDEDDAGFIDEEGELEVVRLSVVSGTFHTTGDIGLAHRPNTRGTLTAAGSDTLVMAERILVGGNVNEARGAGRINIVDGATAQIQGQVLIQAGSILTVEVVGGTQLNASSILNKGLVRLVAGSDLEAGSYSPISATWSLLSDGDVESIGGVWDIDDKLFVVAPTTNALAREAQTIDVTTTQRVAVSDADSGKSVFVGLASNAQAAGGGSTISFKASPGSNPPPGFGRLLQSWDFETDLQEHITTQLSMNIGTGYRENLIRILHRMEGGEWTEIDIDFVYENGRMIFFVDHFSEYAIIAIPEPAQAAMMSGILVLSLLWWRVRTRRRG